MLLPDADTVEEQPRCTLRTCFIRVSQKTAQEGWGSFVKDRMMVTGSSLRTLLIPRKTKERDLESQR